MTARTQRHGRMPFPLQLLAIGSVALLPACGGVSDLLGVTGPGPVRTVLAKQTFTGLPPLKDEGKALLVTFTTPSAGTLEITVDWTSPANNIDLFLFKGMLSEVEAACTGRPCDLQVATATTLNKPERLTYANAAAGPYVLQIGNLGETAEAVTVEIALTTR